MKRVIPNRLGAILLFVGYASNVFIICLLLGSATQHENHKKSKQSPERESVDLRSRKLAIVGADGNSLITFGSYNEVNDHGAVKHQRVMGIGGHIRLANQEGKALCDVAPISGRRRGNCGSLRVYGHSGSSISLVGRTRDVTVEAKDNRTLKELHFGLHGIELALSFRRYYGGQGTPSERIVMTATKDALHLGVGGEPKKILFSSK